MGEVILLRRLGDGVKAHEAVGGKGQDGDDTGEGGLALLEVGLQVAEVRLADESNHQHEEDGRGQSHGHDGLEPTGALDAPDVHDAEADDEGVGQDDLTDVDVPTGDGVEVAELERCV